MMSLKTQTQKITLKNIKTLNYLPKNAKTFVELFQVTGLTKCVVILQNEKFRKIGTRLVCISALSIFTFRNSQKFDLPS